jgi:hypothetical protein
MEFILRRELLTRAVAGFLAGSFVAGLFMAGSQPEAVGLFPPPWDKLVHMIAFGAFTVLVELAVWPHVSLLVAIPLLVSAADELHQAFLPGREASIADWIAGAIGTVLAVYLLRHTRLQDVVDYLLD